MPGTHELPRSSLRGILTEGSGLFYRSKLRGIRPDEIKLNPNTFSSEVSTPHPPNVQKVGFEIGPGKTPSQISDAIVKLFGRSKFEIISL
jgi:hypothetical protein